MEWHTLLSNFNCYRTNLFKLVHINQGSIYLFEVNNGNIGTTCEICLKLTIKTLNIFHNLLQCFYTWPWTSKYQLVLGANFTDKTKAFFHLLQSDANSEPVTNLGGRFCENIQQLKSLKIFYRKLWNLQKSRKPVSISKITPVRFPSCQIH